MKKMMRAANLYAPGDLRIENIPVPKPGPGEVLVKVTACGICGSDIPRVLTRGTYHFPTIPGHEFGGIITETGIGVTRAKTGQRVAVIPLIPCRKCRLCEIGQFAQCENYGFLGSRSDGGFAEYVRVPESNIVPVPDGISDEAAALLEAVATTLHAIQNVGVSWGDTVAVFGLGAIGNLIAQWAKALGAKKVFAVDIDSGKVDIARRVGLEDSVCGLETDVKKYILDKTDGCGVDAAFDASGSEAAFQQAVSVIRTFGRFGLLGRPGKDMVIKDNTFERILRSQITIKGTWSFEFMGFPHHAWEQGLNAIGRKSVILDPVITHRLPLEDTFAAIKMMAAGTEFVNKIIIMP